MSPIEVSAFAEPPCWGSGEVAFIPEVLSRIVKDVSMPAIRFSGTKKKPTSPSTLFEFTLSNFASPNWVRSLRGCTWGSDEGSLDDIVLSALERIFLLDSDRFDVPVLMKPPDHFEGASSLPFESRTWEILEAAGIYDDIKVFALITGTFREIRERLGDTRAAVDVSVTSDAWLTQTSRGSWTFASPVAPTELEDLKKSARIRSFRSCGIDPTLSSYSPALADVLPRNWAVAQAKKWTLEQCSNAVNLTRERIRQISSSQLFEPAQRRWVHPAEVTSLAVEFDSRRDERGDPEMTAVFPILRSDASALLFAYGFPSQFLRSAASLLGALKDAGYRSHEIRRVAYLSSERVGFVTEELLRERLVEDFPNLGDTLIEDVLTEFIKVRDLPLGYAYVEGTERSFFVNETIRLLGLRGRLQFEELYQAASRFYRFRVSGYVFPPRAVIRDFLDRDDRFWFEDEKVDLVDPTPHQLTGVQLWVEDQIREATGSVVYRATLWDLARRDGIKPGTLTVYFGYSLYFKPTGRGCLTLTGSFPSEEVIDIAVAKGSVIRVSPRLLNWKVESGSVLVDLELGTETVDNGVFSPPAAVRRLIQPTAFRVLVDGVQRGNVRWSGNILYGLSTSLSARGCAPGDHLRLQFDVENRELTFVDLTDNLLIED